MFEQSRIESLRAEFRALCDRYNKPDSGLAPNESNAIVLEDAYIHRGLGEFFTIEEIIGDFSALEYAKMLKQLSYSTGAFSIIVKSQQKDYSCPLVVEAMESWLTDMLLQRIEKCKGLREGDKEPFPAMILSKGYGGGYTGRAFVIPYPEGAEPQQEGFSKEELDAIIKFETEARDKWRKSQGNKEKWEEGKSRLPELGKLAMWIIDLLPEGWKDVDKYNFVADYMRGCGFLDFKSNVWLEDFDSKDRKHKSVTIQDWLKAYGNMSK